MTPRRAPPRGKSKNQPCRFFKNGTGCNKGAECPFRHGQLKPTDGQCFNCGSKSHSKPDCPYPKSAQEKPTKQFVQSPKASRDDVSDSDEPYDQIMTNVVGQNQ